MTTQNSCIGYSGAMAALNEPEFKMPATPPTKIAEQEFGASERKQEWTKTASEREVVKNSKSTQ
jgi:hypothetical protein